MAAYCCGVNETELVQTGIRLKELSKRLNLGTPWLFDESPNMPCFSTRFAFFPVLACIGWEIPGATLYLSNSHGIKVKSLQMLAGYIAIL